MAFYRICSKCGASLDPCEKCDCSDIKKEKQERKDEFIKMFYGLCTVGSDGQFRLAVQGGKNGR